MGAFGVHTRETIIASHALPGVHPGRLEGTVAPGEWVTLTASGRSIASDRRAGIHSREELSWKLHVTAEVRRLDPR